MRRLLLAAWWCTTLVAGVLAVSPILQLLAPVLVFAGVASWTGYFRGLRPAAGAAQHRGAPAGGRTAWMLRWQGGALLSVSVLVIGGFFANELGSTAGLELLGLMLVWLAELALLYVAVRGRAGWTSQALLMLCATFFPLPLLVLLLIVLLDMPLTA